MKEKGDSGKKSHKKKTKHNQIHNKPTHRSQAKEFLKRVQLASIPRACAVVKGSGIRDQGAGSREQGIGSRE
jgi:hypothetical protein